MRRLALLLAATAAAVTLIVTLRPHDKPATSRPAALSPAPTATATTQPPPVYRSGTVTGDAARTDYGVVRVRVTVARHEIVNVEAIELPHGNPTDLRLSQPAARTLERWVLHAQSADVDTVSGATYTSIGYLKSLQSALDRLA